MSIVRPNRNFQVSGITDVSQYIHELERWADHIDQLHANQVSIIIEHERVLAELRAINETQMNRINQLLAQQRSDEIVIDDLRADLADRTQDVAWLRGDIDIIREELQSEAEQREWCDDYRRFAERVNQRLTLGRIGPDLREYRTMHTYQVTVTGSVMAYSDDDANERAEAQYGSIREGTMFRLPDDPDDALSHPDRGTLITVRWSHADTTAHNPHAQEGRCPPS